MRAYHSFARSDPDGIPEACPNHLIRDARHSILRKPVDRRGGRFVAANLS